MVSLAEAERDFFRARGIVAKNECLNPDSTERKNFWRPGDDYSGGDLVELIIILIGYRGDDWWRSNDLKGRMGFVA